MGWFTKKPEDDGTKADDAWEGTILAADKARDEARRERNQEWYTFDEALRALQCNEDTMKALVSHGEIRPFRDGGQMRFKKFEVDGLDRALIEEGGLHHIPKAIAGNKPMPRMKIQFDEEELREAIRFYLMAKLPGHLSDAAMNAQVEVLDDDEEESSFSNLGISCIEAQLRV